LGVVVIIVAILYDEDNSLITWLEELGLIEQHCEETSFKKSCVDDIGVSASLSLELVNCIPTESFISLTSHHPLMFVSFMSP